MQAEIYVQSWRQAGIQLEHIKALWNDILQQKPELISNWPARELTRAHDWLESRLHLTLMPPESVIWATELTGDYVVVIDGIIALHKTHPMESKSVFSRWLRPYMLTAKAVLWSTLPKAHLSDGYLEAITPTRYATLSEADIEECLRQSPVLRLVMLGMFVSASQASIDDYYIRRQRLPVRMARLLIDLLEFENQNFSLPFSHRQLAPLIDTHRETITVTLQVLRDAGAINTLRGQIEIVDYEKLLEIAELRGPYITEPVRV